MPRQTAVISVIGSGPGACFFIERLLQLVDLQLVDLQLVDTATDDNQPGEPTTSRADDAVTAASAAGSGEAGSRERGAQASLAVKVVVFEQMPQIGGLIRYGVAPDHAATKNALNRCAQILGHEAVTVCTQLRVTGGIEAPSPPSPPHTEVTTDDAVEGAVVDHQVTTLPWVTRTVALHEIAALSDAVIWGGGPTVGREAVASANDADAQLSPLSITTGLDLARWMNGGLNPMAMESLAAKIGDAETVTVVGNGNVSLDVARNLLRPPEPSDDRFPAMVTAALRRQMRRRVTVLGRRGIGENKFTPLEFREICQIEGAAIVDAAFAADPDAVIAESSDNRLRRRVLETARAMSLFDSLAAVDSCDAVDARESMETPPYRLRFVFRAPIDGVKSTAPVDGVNSTAPIDGVNSTAMIDGANSTASHASVVVTPVGNIPTALLVSCVGYHFATPAGFTDSPPSAADLPVAEGSPHPSRPPAGVWHVGWAQTGARGTIPTNKAPSYASAEAVMAALTKSRLPATPGDQRHQQLLKLVA
ncbi:MAG: hypothetical protein K0U36_01260 [Alphaproteobacteria bacterium]|nr:hypothetical protein [Alphaproteobacteria bacterium]